MKLLLVGGGNMGTALLTGWQKSVADLSVHVIDPHPSEALQSLSNNNCTISKNADGIDDVFDIVVLAIKPQTFPDALPVLKPLIAKQGLVLSIAAGKTLQGMADILGQDVAIIRTMPNTPALIGEGMSVLVANANVDETHKSHANQLLQAVGKTLWLDDENDMHAVTALSGSGPAYVFAMIESMQKAGVNMGLSDKVALQLARQTMLGAAMLAAKQEIVAPAELRRQVTSPGGTTEAGLKILLAENGLDDLMDRTIYAATKRSQDLA